MRRMEGIVAGRGIKGKCEMREGSAHGRDGGDGRCEELRREQV